MSSSDLKHVSVRQEVARSSPTADGSRADEILDITDVARFLNVTVSAIRRWIRERRGPRYFRAGRLIRFRRSDLEAWIEAHSVSGDCGRIGQRRK
jgi:excisionase family DNA binding protein